MRSNMAKDGARIVGDANDLLTGLCTQVSFLFVRTHAYFIYSLASLAWGARSSVISNAVCRWFELGFVRTP